MILSTASSYLTGFFKAQLQNKHCFHEEKGGGGRIGKRIFPGIIATEKEVGKDNHQSLKPKKTDITC